MLNKLGLLWQMYPAGCLINEMVILMCRLMHRTIVQPKSGGNPERAAGSHDMTLAVRMASKVSLMTYMGAGGACYTTMAK